MDRWVAEATILEVLVRPLLVLGAATLVCLLLTWLVTRSWIWAALVADTLVLLTMREVWPALILGLVLVAWPAYLLVRRVTRRNSLPPAIPATLARMVGVIAVVLVLLASVSTVRALWTARPEMSLPAYELSQAAGPNIYLVLLDGYPRADTLLEEFGIDNRPFLAELESRGFEVSPDARTNYNKTWLTLASVLNGAYLDDLLGDQEPPDEPTAELRWLHALIREASIPEALRETGYVIRTVPSAYASTALTTADDYVDHGFLNEFEVRLIAASPWTNLFRTQIGGYLFEQQARQARDTLTTTAELAGDTEQPQFVLSHVHSPHTPFVLTDAHDTAPIPSCFPTLCSFWEARLERLDMTVDEYGQGIREQLLALNALVVAAVDEMIARDPNGVVVLFSDHGLRFATEATDEHFRSFLAARTPRHAGLYDADESPVNLLRRIVDAYLGAGVDALPYRGWSLDWTYNLRLEPLSEPASGLGPSSQ